MEPEMQLPSVGRTVHYVLPDGPSAGEVRPATVVRVWGDPPTAPYPIQLAVLVDGANDYPRLQFEDAAGSRQVVPVIWKTSVVYDEGGRQGTWHWPARV